MQRERQRDMRNSFCLSPSSYDPVSALIRRKSLGGKLFPLIRSTILVYYRLPSKAMTHFAYLCEAALEAECPGISSSLFSELRERLCLEPDPRERLVIHFSILRSSLQSSDVLKCTCQMCSSISLSLCTS